MPPHEEEGVGLPDPQQEAADAEVAIHDQQLAGGDLDAVEQRPLLGVAVLLRVGQEDQATGRLVEGQDLAGQPGGAPVAERHDPVLGAGQGVAVEDAAGIAFDRLGPEGPGGHDQLAGPPGGVADDGGRDLRLHAVELAIGAGGRGDLPEPAPLEGGPRRGSEAASDIGEDADEVRQGPFAGVLALGGVVEEAVEGRLVVEDPVEDQAGHDGGLSVAGEGVEDRRQDLGGPGEGVVAGGRPREVQRRGLAGGRRCGGSASSLGRRINECRRHRMDLRERETENRPSQRGYNNSPPHVHRGSFPA